MAKRIMITASVLGALAVVLGAFGAHALKRVLEVNELEIWAKGVEYQFYHTFALLFLAQVNTERTKLVNLSYLCFTFGILFFSGSLYLLATHTVLNIGFVNYIGPVTPIGGLLLIIGWVLMLASALKHK